MNPREETWHNEATKLFCTSVFLLLLFFLLFGSAVAHFLLLLVACQASLIVGVGVWMVCKLYPLALVPCLFGGVFKFQFLVWLKSVFLLPFSLLFICRRSFATDQGGHLWSCFTLRLSSVGDFSAFPAVGIPCYPTYGFVSLSSRNKQAVFHSRKVD